MTPFRRTKIVATLGPTSESPEVLAKLIEAGVNVVRLNFSHGTAEEHCERARRVREIAASQGKVVGILADIQGPKIRVARFINGKTMVANGSRFILDAALDTTAGTDERVGLAYKELVNEVEPGTRLLLNDGLLIFVVEKVVGSEIHCLVEVGGELSNNKGINREGGGLSAKALTDKDKEDIVTAAKLGADFLAISFPRSGADIEEARALMKQAGGSAHIVAKIERAEAVDDENLTSILKASDVVMVARGDLGLEIGDASVPPAQKKILSMAVKHNCPVIVATQMMESMINNPIPTRAEVSDCANAVLDGADAVMLSGETASGKYPVEAVKALDRTCLEAEKGKVLPSEATRAPQDKDDLPINECIARLTMEAAQKMHAQAVAVFTDSGASALYMSRHVSSVPIYAFTPKEETRGKLTLCRNVVSRSCRNDYKATDAPQATTDALRTMLQDGLVKPGDKVVMALGTPMGRSGTTNTMKIVEVSKELEDF